MLNQEPGGRSRNCWRPLSGARLPQSAAIRQPSPKPANPSQIPPVLAKKPMFLWISSPKTGGHPPKRLRPPPTMKNSLNEFPATRSDSMLSDWVWVKEPDFLVFLVRLFFYARVRRGATSLPLGFDRIARESQLYSVNFWWQKHQPPSTKLQRSSKPQAPIQTQLALKSCLLPSGCRCC